MTGHPWNWHKKLTISAFWNKVSPRDHVNKLAHQMNPSTHIYACTHSLITWTQAHTYACTHSSHEHRCTHICVYTLTHHTNTGTHIYIHIHHMNTGTHIYACTHSFITWTQAHTYTHVHAHCIVLWVHKHTQTQLKMNSKLKIGKFWCERVNAKFYLWIQQL